MLRINNILLKKLKSPLSLRGLFPFCHSRESGNPSPHVIARERSDRSNLDLNGFSLIELMVAAAILAFIVFGIFQAYSTGFMGMADARDRTVATNYAREAMEDVKNMDFEKITTTTKSVTNFNIKYRVDVNVSSESDNLKKVYTVVSWKNRNEIGKTVETTMFVNHTEIYASTAAKLVLYADSYSILNETDDPGGEGTFTKLTAVIKDIKGNTIIDWAGDDVSFLIKSGSEFGNLSGITSTINGIAEETFTSSGYLPEGDVGYTVIEASVNLPDIGNVSDLVTIKITDGPVKIKLEANPETIKASTTNCPTITASLRNAADEILKIDDLVIDVEINFSVFGEGDLSISTITIPAEEGNMNNAEVTIDLCPTGNPGLASVVATATNLESDKADVRFLGSPDSILITASPNPIYMDDEGSTLTVSLLDVNGFSTNPVEGTILVNFTLSPDTNGDLDPTELTFTAYEYEGILLTTFFSGQTTTEAVTITTVNTAGLTNSSVTINILSELVPDRIELTASPQNVAAGSSSTITATVYAGSKTVTNYGGTITFTTTSTSGDFIGVNPTTTTNGIATIEFSDSEGTATVTATASLSGVTPGSVEVGFYSVPDHIKLTASPQNVVAGGSSTITATVCDSNFIHVSNYIGTIAFTIVFEDLPSYDISVDTTNGMASTVLSFDDAGTAAVTASSWYVVGGYELTSEEIEVDFYVETDLILVEESVYYDSANLIVGFEVDVVGEVDILVDEMKIIWTESVPQERFSEILIGGVEVYTGSVKSGTIVDIIGIVNLLNEVHTEIKLTFMQDMTGRQIDVMFYPPVTGWYLIRFDVPEAL